MNRQRRVWIGIASIVVLLLAVVAGVGAAESRQGDECVVAADETISGDFYVACNTLTIEGAVEGDLIGGVWAAAIAEGGSVAGDVWLVGGQLRVAGAVGQDVHFAGVDLDLAETAALEIADVAAVALNVEIWDGATVPGELYVPLGYQAIVRGTVEQDVDFSGLALVVEGAVEGDVTASVRGGDATTSFLPFPFPFSVSFQTPGLTLSEAGRIGGDLTYIAPAVGAIDGTVDGLTTLELRQDRPDITQTTTEVEDLRLGGVLGRYVSLVLTDTLSLLAAGLLILALAPGWVHAPAQLIPRRPAASGGWGLLLVAVAVPVTLLVLLVSGLLLIFLAAVTRGGFTGMALVLLVIVNALVSGGFAFTIVFMARLAVSDLIGRVVGRRVARHFFRTGDPLAINLVALLIGVLLYSLVTNMPLPWVGLVINLAGVVIGAGALVLHGRSLYRQFARRADPLPDDGPLPASPEEAISGDNPPPPPESSDLPAPGMGNLPDGFAWWEDEPPPAAE